jgi:hypothetical protein
MGVVMPKEELDKTLKEELDKMLKEELDKTSKEGTIEILDEDEI